MRKGTLYLIGLLGLLLLAAGCASIGTPSGGPRDEDPPRFISSTPAQGAVEVSPTKVVLTFDELVNVKDAFTKVVVSPPGAQTPRVSSLGRRVTVEFRDTLKPNTTYTIDFGDAIVDNNEGNKLENFIYTFSTGPVLDSLMISGMVLGAEDLIPAEGLYVGLHSNLNDSAFTKTRFDRIAKTNEKGEFVIGGLAPGSYRIYALDDRDGDLAWSSPEETLAFYDAIIEPRSEQTVTTDTLFNLYTGKVDSTATRTRTRYLPNNILLRSFNTGFKQQYITKYERQDSTRFSFLFNAPAAELPSFDVLLPDGTSFPISEVAVTERSANNDSILFWLKDRSLIGTDSLRVAVEYLRADSTFTLRPVNDTLRMFTQRPNIKPKKVEEKKKKGSELSDSIPLPVPTIDIKPVSGKMEINQAAYFESAEPLEKFNPMMVRLEFKEDSVWLPVEDFNVDHVAFDTLNPRKFKVDYPWQYAATYKISIDSLAGKGIYGLFTDDMSMEFSIRPESEYGSLKFNLTNMGADSIPRFVDLLDASGKPMRSLPLENRSVSFRYLLPGKYNVRVVEDLNGNGKWDPGSFEKGVQPDVAYYFKETIELKANWDQEIDWNVFATPVDKMVPETLRKKNTSRR